ncbi:hypothetical protein ACN9MH_03530 [Paenibacillus silvae]|uniref:hypothetical protein n=1 Tax=Paenibacillus TaxID=44249 RepID=UPI001C11B045|nr:hypothetical protein [Paenibacillus barcinonensis]MBU5355934.1 hypothetical protein [Paenibacillus barcinonensis]
MILLANQLAGKMSTLISIESKIVDAKHKHNDEQVVLELENKRSAMIRNFTRDELLVIHKLKIKSPASSCMLHMKRGFAISFYLMKDKVY